MYQNNCYRYYYPEINVYQNPSITNNFKKNTIVSNIYNQNTDIKFDPYLTDPWGIIVLDNQVWIANSGLDY